MSKIYAKLAAIQSGLKAPKSQFNSFGKYAYRSAEDILEAAKPLLAQQGCTLVLTDSMMLVGDRYYLTSSAILTDIETGDSTSTTACAREPETKKGMDDSQITGTASSYARKYALNGLFCIDDTKDADALPPADNRQNAPQPQPQTTAPAPQTAAQPAAAPAPQSQPTARRRR